MALKFPKQKIVCAFLSIKKKMHNNSTLNLDGPEIPVVDQYRFPSVIFDKKLSFIPHIQYCFATICPVGLQGPIRSHQVHQLNLDIQVGCGLPMLFNYMTDITNLLLIHILKPLIELLVRY